MESLKQTRSKVCFVTFSWSADPFVVVIKLHDSIFLFCVARHVVKLYTVYLQTIYKIHKKKILILIFL